MLYSARIIMLNTFSKAKMIYCISDILRAHHCNICKQLLMCMWCKTTEAVSQSGWESWACHSAVFVHLNMWLRDRVCVLLVLWVRVNMALWFKLEQMHPSQQLLWNYPSKLSPLSPVSFQSACTVCPSCRAGQIDNTHTTGTTGTSLNLHTYAGLWTSTCLH